mmetsp:Transcript_31743/g.46676  ORF Transcript_31743/g.46676 Transcript_31743/m.46676 type:complete len:290 (-) Transcript_31743:1463-2332(-)
MNAKGTETQKSRYLKEEGGIAQALLNDVQLQLQLEEIQKDTSKFEAPPVPSCPLFDPTMSMQRRITKIQRYISSFEYNHTGRTFFHTKKNRGMKHLVHMAKTIVREALPIQCVEAVFLGVYLTNGMKELLRIPISFKSIVDTNEHDHIILAIRYRMKWGAIGISRVSKLMYKELKHNSLADLATEYRTCYDSYCHKVVQISVGLPFTHDVISETPLQWKVMRLTTTFNDGGGGKDNNDWDQLEPTLLQYTRDCLSLLEYYIHKGFLPEWCDEDYRCGKINIQSCRKRLV